MIIERFNLNLTNSNLVNSNPIDLFYMSMTSNKKRLNSPFDRVRLLKMKEYTNLFPNQFSILFFIIYKSAFYFSEHLMIRNWLFVFWIPLTLFKKCFKVQLKVFRLWKDTITLFSIFIVYNLCLILIDIFSHFHGFAR